jgi:hypothetical protein
LRNPRGVITQPLATGFMPTARRPDAFSADNKLALTNVLPMPVSVPVMKTPPLIAPTTVV